MDEALRRDERALDLGEITPAVLFWRRVRAGIAPATAGAGLGPSVVLLVYDAGGIPAVEHYRAWARAVFRPLCRTMLARIKVLGGRKDIRLTGPVLGQPLESWPVVPARALHSHGTWVDRRRAPPLVWRVRFNGRPCTVRFTGTVSATPVEQITFNWSARQFGDTIPDAMALAKNQTAYENIFTGVAVEYGQITSTNEGEPGIEDDRPDLPDDEDDLDPDGGCRHNSMDFSTLPARCRACGFVLQGGESVDDADVDEADYALFVPED